MGLLADIDALIDDAAEQDKKDDAEKMDRMMKLAKGGVMAVYPSDEPEKEPEVVIQDGIALGGFEMPRGVY